MEYKLFLNCLYSVIRARLEELKIFLESEAWELCPVRSTFSLHQLRVRLIGGELQCMAWFVFILIL